MIKNLGRDAFIAINWLYLSYGFYLPFNLFKDHAFAFDVGIFPAASWLPLFKVSLFEREPVGLLRIYSIYVSKLHLEFVVDLKVFGEPV